MAIRVTMDSTCDLSPDLVKKYNITVVPMHVHLGEKQYLDGVDLSPDDIYAYVSGGGNTPKTAAINTEEYLDVFRPMRQAGDEVIHINIGSALSRSYESACAAAEELGGIEVIDSENLSTGSGHLVLIAAEAVASGLSLKETADMVRKIVPRVDASFVIDTLTYLRRGGRCSALAALGANLLSLKPCIRVGKGGAMHVGKKYRGTLSKCLGQYVSDQLAMAGDIDTRRVFITHSGVDKKIISDVQKQVSSLLPFDEVIVTRAGCTVSGHCGPGTLGVLFIHNKDEDS
jgi:DegV family protein with EDD domain